MTTSDRSVRVKQADTHSPRPNIILIISEQHRREQFFDLGNDPDELRDLGGKADAQERIARWRETLIRELHRRPEGFSDENRLITGRSYPPVLPHALPEEERIPDRADAP
ncbi:MAG: hypothetical protein JW955_10000 [Sedimentisphaerales bacterium]|nr:hypothetical protein [Sedimentisphaerales bacterium]